VLASAAAGWHDGLWLMHLLNGCQLLVAGVCIAALGHARSRWLPWQAFGWGVVGLRSSFQPRPCCPAMQLPRPGSARSFSARSAAALVVLLSAWRSRDLRAALRR
jgi:hypothetical protein